MQIYCNWLRWMSGCIMFATMYCSYTDSGSGMAIMAAPIPKRGWTVPRLSCTNRLMISTWNSILRPHCCMCVASLLHTWCDEPIDSDHPGPNKRVKWCSSRSMLSLLVPPSLLIIQIVIMLCCGDLTMQRIQFWNGFWKCILKKWH